VPLCPHLRLEQRRGTVARGSHRARADWIKVQKFRHHFTIVGEAGGSALHSGPHWKKRIQHSLALLLILLLLVSLRSWWSKDACGSFTFWTVSTRRSALLASNACELSARLQQEMQHERAQQPPADVEAANLAPCVAAALLPWLATLDLPQWLTPAAELTTELGEAIDTHR
jgi:hypothetical protein